MKNSNQSELLDEILRGVLSETEGPSPELNERIQYLIKERNNMKPAHKKRISTAFIAAAIVLIMTTTAFAAWQFLSPGQVAEQVGAHKLAKAFDGSDAIKIDKSIISGGYQVSLLGIVSGENLGEVNDPGINTDKTYAVVSIAKGDKSPMPAGTDPNYGEIPFFVSPLVKGVEQQWLVNASTMNGGYAEFVEAGIMYRLVECNNVEMFADRGLYLCVISTNFYDKNAYSYDAKTGTLTSNPDFKGTNALFDLPIDKAKADHVKAEKYLNELLNPQRNDQKDGSGEKEADSAWVEEQKAIEKGAVVSGSVKTVTIDKDGFGSYKFGDLDNDKLQLGSFFEAGEVNVWKTLFTSSDDTTKQAMQFSRNEKGVIQGRLVNY